MRALNEGESRPRVVLLEPDEARREVLARRLQAQLFDVDAFGDPSEAANQALANPPAALIADVWMQGVSGVQICRLMRSEQATCTVPIILRAEGNESKARFWSEQAGAAAYVPKGRIGELVRALNHAIENTPPSESFFTQLAHTDVRDRIALHLDRALFESVIASSVRALSTSESFDLLFDLFSQFVCRLTSYRWLAISTIHPERLAVHAHPANRQSSQQQAREALNVTVPAVLHIEDEDACESMSRTDVLIHDILFGNAIIGRMAVLPIEEDPDNAKLVKLIAREIGGPLRIATLVEESQRLARYDPLTGIMNRRAFVEGLENAIDANAESLDGSLSLLLLDVDHFKSINDRFGHSSGDRVLSEMGAVVSEEIGALGGVARWGGEEFVVYLTAADLATAETIAERLRIRIEEHTVYTDHDEAIPITVSIGVAELMGGEVLDSLVERADQAMYAAKVSGRNQVRLAGAELDNEGDVAPTSERRASAAPAVAADAVGE